MNNPQYSGEASEKNHVAQPPQDPVLIVKVPENKDIVFGTIKEMKQRIIELAKRRTTLARIEAIVIAYSSIYQELVSKGEQANVRQEGGFWKRKQLKDTLGLLGFEFPHSPGRLRKMLEKRKDDPSNEVLVKEAEEVFRQVLGVFKESVNQNERDAIVLQKEQGEEEIDTTDHEAESLAVEAKLRQELSMQITVLQRDCSEMRREITKLSDECSTLMALHSKISTSKDPVVSAQKGKLVPFSKVEYDVQKVVVITEWDQKTLGELNRFYVNLDVLKQQLQEVVERLKSLHKEQFCSIKSIVETVLAQWDSIDLPSDKAERSKVIAARCEFLSAFRLFPKASAEYFYLQEIRYR